MTIALSRSVCLQDASVVLSGSWVVLILGKDVWKYASYRAGVPCVTTCGTRRIPVLPADKLDIQEKVQKYRVCILILGARGMVNKGDMSQHERNNNCHDKSLKPYC